MLLVYPRTGGADHTPMVASLGGCTDTAPAPGGDTRRYTCCGAVE